MKKNTHQEASEFLTRNRRRRTWKKIVGILSCVVIVCTVYMLILNATTLGKKTNCGKDEHIHSEECYAKADADSEKKLACSVESLEIHKHKEECFNENGEQVCLYADFAVHEHNSACYDADGNLLCKFPEVKAHTHTDNCYENVENNEVHIHTASCYTEKKKLVCNVPESDGHKHEAGCYDENGGLVCSMDESEGHHHSAACYETTSELTCNLPTGIAGQTTESERKLICDKTEIILHEHGPECFDEDDNLICDKIQVLEHVHSDDCFQTAADTEEGTLICGMEEHTHTEDCVGVAKPEEAASAVNHPENPPEPVAVANLGEGSNYSSLSLAQKVRKYSRSTNSQTAYLNEADSGTEEAFAGEVMPLNEEGIDFTGHIKEVVIERKNGNDWVPVTGAIKKDDEIRFKLNYNIPGKTLSDGNRTISYQLPATLNILQKQSGKVYNDAGKEVGTYEVSMDGKVKITFGDSYIDSNKKGNPITGYVAVEAKVDQSQSSGNTTQIDFGNGLKVDVTIEEPDQDKSDIDVEKTGGEVNSEGKVSYTITVNSKNGTSSEVKLTDIMESMNLEGNVTVSGKGINNNNYTVTRTDKGFDVILPQMSAGASYTITYEAKLPTNAVADINGKNTVHVESTNKNNVKIEDSDTEYSKYQQTYVSKTGMKDGDKIVWTITVNAGRHDIGGWTLSDVFNDVAVTGEVTMTGSDGSSQKITLPYTFPEGSNAAYTIIYKTPAEKPLGGNKAKNRVELKPENGPGAGYEDYEDVGDGSNFNPLSKNAGALNVIDKNTAIIQWNVTVDAKDGDILAPWFYKDTLENEQYFTTAQIDDLKIAVDNAIQDTGLHYSFEEIKKNNQIIGFKLTFDKTMQKGQSFSFSYNSTAPLKGGETEIYFKNNGNINDKVYSAGNTTYKPVVRKFDQSKSDGSDTEHSYYDTVMDEKGVLKWGIVVAVPKDYQGGKLTITETLPEGVELKKLTMVPEWICNEGDITAAGEHTFKTHDQQTTYTVKTTQNGQVITIEIPEALAQNGSLQQIRFSIQAKIKDKFQWPVEEGIPTAFFKNTVEVSSENGETHGIDDQTQKVTKDDTKDVLTKSHGTVEDNIIPYSIIVNPDGKDLLAGGDTLTLSDAVKVDTKYNATNTILNLVPDSVKVYKLNPDGSQGEQIRADEVPYTLEITYEGTESNPYTQYLMKMTLPDNTPLKVVYKYKVNSKDIGQNKKIENTAKLEGVAESTAEGRDEFWVNITHSSAGAQTNGLTALKVNADNYGITLQDVSFRLYQYKDGKYVLVTDEKGAEKIYTTSADGDVSLSGLAYNTAYYLEEVDAPAGYLKPEEPYYFWITNSDTSYYPVSKPDDFSGKEFKGGEVFYIPNETSTAQINVVKKWVDKGGTENTDEKSGTISFGLYQKKSTTKPNNGKVKIRWRVYSYGGLVKDVTKEDVVVGSVVTVTSEAVRNDFNTPPQLTVNGKNVTPQWKRDDKTFTYTFIADVNTDVMIESSEWQFQPKDGAKYEVTDVPPQTSGSDTTEKLLGTYTISSEKNWKWSSKEAQLELPKTGIDENGKTVYYTYYVKEVSVPNCTTEYTENDGIVSGTITIKNTQESNPEHQLPATGGNGTAPYTAGGLLLAVTAGAGMFYNRRRHRRRTAAR